jgi:predicted dinucleotide-binding enzyme
VPIFVGRGAPTRRGLVKELGPSIKAGTAKEAASADIVLVAVRWVDLEKALGDLPAWNGRIVVDGTNPVAFLDPDSAEAKDPSNPLAAYGIKAIDLGGKHSSEVFSGFVPGARVIKAFNHLDASVLPDPVLSGGLRTLFHSGDDAGAKAEVRKIVEQTGYFPVDLGALNVGGPLASLPFGSLAAVNFIRILTLSDIRTRPGDSNDRPRASALTPSRSTVAESDHSAGCACAVGLTFDFLSRRV